MRVMLGDDEVRVRSALKLSLAQISALEIVGEAADAMRLLQEADRQQPELLLLDWELPGLPAEHLLRLLWFQQPELRVIAMSSRPEAEQKALNAGVWRFISKNDPPDQVLAAICSAF